jgi:hypothetical protein
MLYCFADESGTRGFSEAASDCFVMAAVTYLDHDEPRAHDLLGSLRAELRRLPTHPLKWENIKGHAPRLHVAQTLGRAEFLDATAVVVCKRAIDPAARLVDEGKAYLYTYRFLLERLSWTARARRQPLRYTIAHIVRFKTETLQHYETLLFEGNTQVAWDYAREHPLFGHPEQVQCLQLADLTASAIAAAFNKDPHGNTEPRYLKELLPALTRGRERLKLTSYGLKMHPWNARARELYPWVGAL